VREACPPWTEVGALRPLGRCGRTCKCRRTCTSPPLRKTRKPHRSAGRPVTEAAARGRRLGRGCPAHQCAGACIGPRTCTIQPSRRIGKPPGPWPRRCGQTCRCPRTCTSRPSRRIGRVLPRPAPRGASRRARSDRLRHPPSWDRILPPWLSLPGVWESWACLPGAAAGLL